MGGLSEKPRRIFAKDDIPRNFRPGTTLRQRLVHTKDKPRREKLNYVIDAVKCSSDCSDLYIGDRATPHRHRRVNTSGQWFSGSPTPFQGSNVHISDREDRWFERGVKRPGHHWQIYCTHGKLSGDCQQDKRKVSSINWYIYTTNRIINNGGGNEW